MNLRSLRLLRFRNYEEKRLEFNPNLNIICGPNAQGKTTILEGIYYLMLGRSFRSHQHSDLVKYGCGNFSIEGEFSKHDVGQILSIAFDGKERRIQHNSTPINTISNLVGTIPGVLSTPDDIALIKGAPHLRRQWMDIQIAQADPLYIHHLSRYGRAVRQRNHLLKEKQFVTMESWERELSHSAAYVSLQRQRLIDDLQPYCQKFCLELTEQADLLEIHYRGTLAEKAMTLEEREDFLFQLMQKNRARDSHLGYTSSGPHKDDLSFTIGGKEAYDFASEGQQRGCVTALRLGEWHRLRQAAHVPPLMMIDDIGLSLDAKRRERLIEQLKGLGQVFVTTTDTEFLKKFSC